MSTHRFKGGSGLAGVIDEQFLNAPSSQQRAKLQAATGDRQFLCMPEPELHKYIESAINEIMRQEAGQGRASAAYSGPDSDMPDADLAQAMGEAPDMESANRILRIAAQRRAARQGGASRAYNAAGDTRKVPTVQTVDRQGSLHQVPNDQLPEALQAGHTVVLPMTRPDGKHGYVPAHEMSAAVQRGYMVGHRAAGEGLLSGIVDRVSPTPPLPPAPPPPGLPQGYEYFQPQDKLVQAQDDAMQNPAFDPSGERGTPERKTRCNLATVDILKKLGGPVDPLVDKQGNPLLVNQMVDNLTNPQVNKSYTVVTPEAAQEYANKGGVALAIQPNPGGHGHIVTVRPNTDYYSDSGINNLKGTGPIVNHIGGTKGIRRASEAFLKNQPIMYYVPLNTNSSIAP